MKKMKKSILARWNERKSKIWRYTMKHTKLVSKWNERRNRYAGKR